jgi:hypothetical protein
MKPMSRLRRPPRKRWPVCLWVAVSTGLLGAAPSFAQSSGATARSPAEKLFEEGRRLVGQKRFAAACPKFAASQALEAGIGVGLWLADCLESDGQTASAWGEFVRTATLAGERGDPREAVARARAEALLPRLSRIVLATPPGLEPLGGSVEVTCDGSPVSPTRWVSGFYVDPGMHHLRGATAGRAFWEADVDVGSAADVQTLTLPNPPGSSASASFAPPMPPPASPPKPASLRATGPSRATLNIAAGSSAGLGVVAVGLGVYFGVAAKNDNDASTGGCGSKFCSTTSHDLRVDALHNATASDVAFAVGAAAIAGGVVLYVVGRGRTVPASLSVGASSASLRIAF